MDYRDECDEGNGSDLESTGEEEEIEEDFTCEMEDVEAIRARQAALDEDVAPEGREVLTRVTNLQREQHIKGSPFILVLFIRSFLQDTRRVR